MSTVINKFFYGRKKEGGLEQDSGEFDPAICDAILNEPMVPPIMNYNIGIHEAALMDLPELVQHILYHTPIYLNLLNQSGWTPLMYAAQNGSYYVCELLLNYGARVDIRNQKGQTAIDLAHDWGHDYLLDMLEYNLWYQQRNIRNPYQHGANSNSY